MSNLSDTITTDEALAHAVQLHRTGRIEIAEELYGRVLHVAPDHPDALHFLGLLKHQTGHSGEAIALLRRAIDREPEEAGMHSNLGNILMQVRRPDLAVQAFETAIVLDAACVDARSNLGVALRALGRLDEAETVYREALALDAGHRDLWDNLGRLLSATGRIDEAIRAHARALELEPRNADTRRHLISAYAATGDSDRALTILKGWLAEDPLNASARHLVAAISGKDVPPRASDRYVETMFDSFADSFDGKLARLGYRAPELVGGAATLACGMPGEVLCVLDAGCGTGLLAPFLRPLARRLVGVDLSARMLDKARNRGGYDELVQAELTGFLSGEAGVYDLVVSADTLCYFGALDAVVGEVARALRRPGVLAFTVEEEAGHDPHRLNPTGRFSHREDYVEEVLREAGFRVLDIARETLRHERGRAVAGLVVAAVI